MKETGLRWIAALIAIIAALAGLSSASGVFLRGSLTTVPFVTVRGEHVDVLVDGVYRHNGIDIAAEGVGWDFVTLFLVLPALLLLLPTFLRGSLRSALGVAGILAYLFYQSFEYAVALAYGPLFIVYVATFALSLSGIAAILLRVDHPQLASRFGPEYPRRAVIGLGLWMAGLLLALWLPLIARTLGGTIADGDLDGATTFVVPAFDLGLLVPIGLIMALAVHRRHVVGHVLSSIIVVKAVAMPIAIGAMLVFEAFAGEPFQPVPFVVFALTAAVSALIGIRLYASIGPGEPAPAGTRATAAPSPAG
jgi:hypothetical protein